MRSYFDPYQILGLPSTASRIDIIQAYRKLALAYHPDKFAGKSPQEIAEAEAHFKDINRAYEQLIKNNDRPHRTYHAFHGNEMDIVEYQEVQDDEIESASTFFISDQESLTEPKEKYQSKINPIKNINKKRSSKVENFDMGFLFKNFKPIYNSTDIENLTKEQIIEKISSAENRYRHISHKITESSFLWLAEKKNCAPIYIFGTQHIFNLDFDDIFGDVIDNLLDKVDVVFSEITRENFRSYSIDDQICKKAHERGKILKPLENEMIVNAAMPIDRHLYDFDRSDRDNVMSMSYLTSIAGPTEMSETSEVPLIKQAIKRNIFWMPNSILPESSERKNASLHVVGCGHNAGKFGLPNLLAAEGYQLNPLMKIAPTPKSTIVKNLFYGRMSSVFSFFHKNKILSVPKCSIENASVAKKR